MNKVYLTMEVPVQLLDTVDPLIDGHFVIATELLNNSKYLEWYTAYGKRKDRNLVMLDNGAYEEETVDAETLYELGWKINADLVWAPDTLFKGTKSTAQTENFLLMMQENDKPFKVGIIPQGANAKEIINNYIYLKAKYSHLFDYVGLSFKNPREEVVNFITEPVHYLGLRSLNEIETWPINVVSMDTVKPVKAAAHNLLLEDCQRGMGVWNADMIVEHQTLLYRNIARLHQALTR